MYNDEVQMTLFRNRDRDVNILSTVTELDQYPIYIPILRGQLTNLQYQYLEGPKMSGTTSLLVVHALNSYFTLRVGPPKGSVDDSERNRVGFLSEVIGELRFR